MDEVNESHGPIRIVGKRSAAHLVSEEHWRAIQETLHLTPIPGVHCYWLTHFGKMLLRFRQPGSLVYTVARSIIYR